MLGARPGITVEERGVVVAGRVGAPPAEAGGRPRRVVVRLARRHLRHKLMHTARVRRTVTDATGGRVYQRGQLFHQVREESPRTSGASGGTPDNLPPLTFHSVHGKNVKVSSDGSIASRKVSGFEHGIAYSARPVKVNEKMCLRIVGTPQCPSDMFFGFTCHDPATHAHTLPEYVIDIFEQPGIWVEGQQRSEVLLRQFDYYVNSAGDVHFSINGEDKGLFLTGVDTRYPLWALVYLFRAAAVKFVDVKAPNQVKSPLDEDRLQAPRSSGAGGTPDNLPPLTFHSVHGENVRVFNDGSFAIAVEASGDCIAFSARPVMVNEKVCLRFVGVTNLFNAMDFSFGFTSHDPATFERPLSFCLRIRDFINKPGNWVKAQRLFIDYIFDYYVNSAGDVHSSINGEDRGLFLAGVDTKKPLWALILLNRGATIQFLDPRLRAPYQVRRQNQSPIYEDRLKAPRTPGTGGTPDDLPPLTFHSVHGECVRVFNNGSIVKRVQGLEGNGIAFSVRPVKINEKVCFHFVGTPHLINTGFYFGFTSHDPATVAHTLRKKSFNFITRPGNWTYIANSMKGFIFDYYVNSAGDVHFSINGENKRLLFTGVDTKNPLWAFVDVRDQAVQFVAPRPPNQIRRPNETSVDEDRLLGSMRSLGVDEPLPPPRYANPLVPLSLHRIKGRNVQFVNDRGVAARVVKEIDQGYVFTAQPMLPGQTIVVQILTTNSTYDGSLSFGLTSCDPASLRPSDLPADAELLLDRPEYWVVQRNAANGLGRGDELAMTLTMDGQVRVSRNGSTPMTNMHVDHTVELWAFVDVGGAIQKVRMLTTKAVTSPPYQSRVPTGTAAPLAVAGGTVLVDSLPPQNNAQNAADHQQGLTHASAHNIIEPIQAPSQPCVAGQQPAKGNLTETECRICYDNPIDSVLCNCGHMCMCHSCAVEQWKGKGSGQCPICRAKIKKVLRIYKS